MIDRDSGCRLTATDYRTCKTLLERMEGCGSPLAPLVREKLAGATVVAPHEIGPLVATLNSRVEFQIDDAPPELRILVGTEFRNGLVGLTLPVSTPYGLALLGLRQGSSATVRLDGEARRVLLRRVAYQPEAARFRHALPVRPFAAASSASCVIDFSRAREQRGFEQRRLSR